MLREALDTLGHQVRVVEVPSGEEALLLFRRSPIDLLILDIRLAGMTGFELLNRARRQIPDIKVIMVTGMQDQQTRQKIRALDVAAYFYKPVRVPEFLNKVEEILGLGAEPPARAEHGASKAGHSPHPVGKKTGPLSLMDILGGLQEKMEAAAVVLIDENGRILARAGDGIERECEANLIHDGMTILSAGAKIGYYLEKPQPEGLYSIQGGRFNLHLAHISGQLALMVVTQPDESARTMQMSFLHNLQLAVIELVRYLPRAAIPVTQESETESHGLLGFLEAEGMAGLDEFFDQAADQDLDAGDVNRFWDQAASEANSKVVSRPDVLTFEQARRMGLALPDDE